MVASKPALNLKDEDTGNVVEAKLVPYQGPLS